MGISFKMGKWSVCGVYTSLKPMIHFDSKQSQFIFNQNYYKNALANNCKQCSILIINHTTTPLPKAYDCVAVYIAGRRTSLVVYGWWPQPPTKNIGYCLTNIGNIYWADGFSWILIQIYHFQTNSNPLVVCVQFSYAIKKNHTLYNWIYKSWYQYL